MVMQVNFFGARDLFLIGEKIILHLSVLGFKLYLEQYGEMAF